MDDLGILLGILILIILSLGILIKYGENGLHIIGICFLLICLSSYLTIYVY